MQTNFCNPSYQKNKTTKKLCLFVLLLVACCSITKAQSFYGKVLNDAQNPIPFANLFFTELNTGTSCNENGAFYYTITPGQYEVVFSALGYISKKVNIVVEDKDLNWIETLSSTSVELTQIVVKAKKRDPAYGIIQNAIDAKQQYINTTNACKTYLYIKATEEIEKKIKPKPNNIEIEIENKDINQPLPGRMALAAPKIPDSLSNLNMVEIEATLNYQAPNLYKEERTAYKSYGNTEGLYLPIYGQSNFNFYNNYINLPGLVEIPIISPLSRTSILSYKFKLIETFIDNERAVYKIKITPRKKGNATVSGHIYINDALWNIYAIDIDLAKSTLKFYDAFTVDMKFKPDSLNNWLVAEQKFSYQNKAGKTFYHGNTNIFYKGFEYTCKFPKNYFGNELLVTTKAALEKQGDYWEASRPKPLSTKQAQVVAYTDSVEKVINSKPYKDSIQVVYNQVEPMEILWFGVGLQNHEKKSDWFFNSLASNFGFNIIGGFRYGTGAQYSKIFENGQRLRASASGDVGLKYKDVKGNVGVNFLYKPHRLARAGISYSSDFAFITLEDAVLQLVQPSNFILNDHLNLRHKFELVNGLYLSTNAAYFWRRPIPNGFNSVYEDWFPNRELEGEIEPPIQFNPYQALITEVGLSFTPAQKYLTEPNRKLVLGSKWPTFSIFYQKGWQNILGSDINFDYLQFNVDHNLILGQFGTSKYNIKTGRFFNAENLGPIEVKRFRRSDRWWFSNPLQSYQLLDTLLTTKQFFLETHYIHHFNGALINNIPIVKKLALRLVAGAGAMWLQENNFKYFEGFAGIERIFKLGPRRRLRLGAFGVVANGNFFKTNARYKFSIDIIDTFSREWNF